MCSVCGFMQFNSEEKPEYFCRQSDANYRKYIDVFGDPWDSSWNLFSNTEDVISDIASTQIQSELRRLFNAETAENGDPKLIPPIYNLFEERYQRKLWSSYIVNCFRMNLSDGEINFSSCHSCSLTYDTLIPWRKIFRESYWWSLIYDSKQMHLRCSCAHHHVWQAEEQEIYPNSFYAPEEEEIYMPLEPEVRPPRPLLGTHKHSEGLQPEKLKERKEQRRPGFGWRGFRGRRHQVNGDKTRKTKNNSF